LPFCFQCFCSFSILQSACLSVCICVLLSIYGSTALRWALAAFSLFLIFYTVGRGSACRKATTYTQNNINSHKYSCLKWDSNPRSQCLSGRR
jgi:hypothetical protein